MSVVIDVGNSNVTIGRVGDNGGGAGGAGELGAVHRLPTERPLDSNVLERGVAVALAAEGLSLADLSRLALASVIPEYTLAFQQIARRQGWSLLVAGVRTIPIPIRVERPDEVGADRLVNAFAAGRLHGTPAVVIDLGTATTFDAVAADGAYVGGAIAAGLRLGLDALAERTAQLPRVTMDTLPRRAIGRDTQSAMASGALFGHRGLIGELTERISHELAGHGERPRTILTGGFANTAWARTLPGIDAIDPELTLRGLALLLRESQSARPETAGAPVAAGRTP
jgi:type III pantothenate kinase